MKIVLTGSLGNISKPLLKVLIDYKQEVVVISSKPEKAEKIIRVGAQPAIGSLEDVNFLKSTFTNVDAVYAMIPPNYQENNSLIYYMRIANNYKKALEKESSVRLRLLEPAKMQNHIIPQGTVLTANSKFNQGRLQIKITSIELDGTILPVDLTIYGLDGQQGLFVPYSPEMSALKGMAANMGQTSGSSIMLSSSPGQQIAGDLSRGLVQGISGYFSKKMKTPKVTLKAGLQVFLVSKK